MVKDIEPFCEYCRRRDCDRMQQWDALAFEYDNMFRNTVMDNNKKGNICMRLSSIQSMVTWGKGIGGEFHLVL